MKLRDRVRVRSTGLIACAAILAVAVLLGLAETYPYRPSTTLGWLLFVLVGIPIGWIISGAFEALVDRDPAGRWMNRRTASKRFSWVRVLYLFLRRLFLLAVVMLTIWVAVSYVPALRELGTWHFGQ
jgi:hypothetical protein